MIGFNQCAVVIPCFNEARTIAALAAESRRLAQVVLVVDDGSTDATRLEAEAAGATVLRHARNEGKGAALRTGLGHACERGFLWAVTLDGDGQHRPADIPRFLECAARTGAALVVGNRLQNPRAMPWVRRTVNQWMSRQLSAGAGRRLPDSQCGFRLVNLGAWADLSLTTNHFEIESEMLLAFLAAGHQVEFVPIEPVKPARPSRIQPVLDTWRWWRWWRKIMLAPGAGGRLRR